jgi:GntR family transcriptional regulator
MLIRLDEASTAPLFEQIAAGIRRAIASGEVAQGQQLPAGRDLASALGVNMHTVLRAYAQLRDEGLIELRRRRGAVVQPSAASASAQATLTELARSLLAEARRQGLSRAEVVALIDRLA